MSIAFVEACRTLKLASTPKNVLMYLAYHCDGGGTCTEIHSSIASISEWTGFAKSSVLDALELLEAERLITRSRAGRGRTCRIDLPAVMARTEKENAGGASIGPPAGSVVNGKVRQPDLSAPDRSASRTYRDGGEVADRSASRTCDPAPIGPPAGPMEGDRSARHTCQASIGPPAGSVEADRSASRTYSPQLAAIGIHVSTPVAQEEKKTTPSCPELELAGERGELPAVAHIPLVDGTEFAITQGHVDELALAFPGVDIAVQLRRARIWCNDNPKQRKTKGGVRRFITGWMGRAQNDAAKTRAPGQRSSNRTPSRHTGFDQTAYEGAPDGSIPIPE